MYFHLVKQTALFYECVWGGVVFFSSVEEQVIIFESHKLYNNIMAEGYRFIYLAFGFS